MFLIFSSIFAIKQYLMIAAIAVAFYGFLTFGIRIKYFNSAREWPSKTPVMAIIMVVASYVYAIVMVHDDINNYIKYIILVSSVILYVLAYTNANKQLKV